MSGKFNLTPRAKEDLRGVWVYSFDMWGEAQANNYITALYRGFETLTKQPKLGKHRLDIQDGYYCFPQGSHLIFYLINDSTIDIIGIPHKNMDILNYFD